MKEPEIRQLIEHALGAVDFTPPIDVPYCAAVRDALRKSLPGASLEVFHRVQAELVVRVEHEGAVCTLALPLV